MTLSSSSGSGNQWYLNGNPIGGATNQQYVATVSGDYTVIVTVNGSSSAPSTATTVTVNPIPATPTITPGGPTTFCAGGNVTLTSSSASGNQWFLNGNSISGATNQTYNATTSGSYTVVVTASGCSSAASGPIVVTVNPIPPTPTITPGGPTTFCAGGSVTLTSSSASGNQWYLNGNSIGGATNQTYNATASDSYTVRVTDGNGCSSAASASTTVTVNPIPPTPTITPGGPTAFCTGGSVTLTSSSASGNQWYLNGNPIGGATNQTYNATAAGNYTVVVTTNSCSSAPSAPTTVTVKITPAIVTTTADSGAGSLRQALLDVCDAGTITFSNSTANSAVNFYDGTAHTITLTSGELAIASNVTITGPGANVLTISGGNASRVFNISGGVTATLDRLTIANGKVTGSDNRGGGILNAGTLTLANSTVSGSSVITSGNLSANRGGGIYNNGTLTVLNSTLSTNVVGDDTNFGGGINNEGGTVVVVNSTISGNSASNGNNQGGGIYCFSGTINITNCTISGNSANSGAGTTGGGILNFSGTVDARNTIIAGNTAGQGPDVRGSFASQGHNLIGKSDGSTGFINGTNSDQVGTSALPIDPKLGGLSNNGGPTQTLLPALGSPVINAAADWTTLTGNIVDGAQTTITVADGSAMNAGSTIRIDTEQMGVTARSGNTLTVTRGANATTAAAHSSGAGVSAAFDQRGFPRKISVIDIGAVETNYTITTTAGTPQSTKVNTAFPTALQATVKESGTALNNVSVTFTPPGSGASGTFAGGTPATVSTNGSGVATAPTFTANAIAGGPYTVSASVTGIASTADFSLTNTPPTVTIDQASGQADPTTASPINFTVVFSDPVTGFSSSGVTLSGTAGATSKVVTGSGTTYNVAVSGMTAQPGTVIATVNAGAATDGGGNTNTASTSTDNTVTYDTPPSVTINQASGQADPTNASPINFTVVFSEAVTGFGSSGVTLPGTAGATTKVVTGSGTTYNVAVSGMTSQGTVIATVNAGAATDSGSNPNTASTSTDNTVTYDTAKPGVTINQASGQSDPTNASPINFTVVFSEPVTGFGSGSVTLSGTAGATTKVVTGSGTTYNVAVSGMTSDGTVIATVPAGGAADAAGNTNNASTSTDNTVTYDTVQPSVTINQASTQSDPTNASPINFTVVFSEPVTGFGSGSVTLSGTAGATTKVVTGSGTTYNVAVSGMTSDGTVIATVPAGGAADAAGNTNTASTSTDNTVTYDTVQPAVMINQGASTQADPTNTSPINFTVVFSEAVTGFGSGSVTLSGTAGATTKVVTGFGTTYNVAVSGMTSPGTVIATVPAGGAADAAGNTNTASTSTDNTVTYDNVQPSVTINQASGQADPTTSSPINFTVVFSEPVSGFSSSGVMLSGTAGATAKSVTGSGATYNVAVSGMTSKGTVTATVPAGGTTDAAGNTSTASTSTDNTVTFNTLATHFTVSAPVSAIPNTSFSFTVSALDQFNNPPTSYPGTVHFTSTDVAGILPVDSTLSGGTGTFNATLKTPGSQTITATDTSNSSITGTSNAIAVGKTSPTISTQASTGINLGAGTISDSATLAGGSAPTGSITFRLYGPNDATCGSAAVFTSAAIPVNGNATYSSGNFTPTAPGTYRWIASYSGDANNAVAGTCNDANESVVVNKANPAISGTVSPASGNLGTPFTDTATLSDGTSPTGTITFTVHGPNTDNCATPIFTSTRTVAGNANYASDAFTPSLPGMYQFLAVYNGDTNNNSVATTCGAASQTFVVNGPSPSPTPTPTATPAQALNISTRMRTELGDKAMIGGFIITGNASKSLVLRGIGPSLSAFNLSDLLLDPELELRGSSNNLIFKNKNWKDDQRPLIEGTNFQPKDDRESVIVITLNAGAYTALLSGKDDTEGIGLVEIYDTNPAAASELGNISTRGMVRTDDKVMIGGFTLGGPNNATRIAVRGRGPSLSQFNLSPLLANPVLELRNENGTIMVTNDDWQDDPVSAANLTANGLGLSDPKESGIFISLTPPGQFTAILSGKNGGIGIGLVEIYNLK